MVAIVAKIQPLYTSTELNLRVLGEVEKNSFIALPDKAGGPQQTNALKPCVTTWSR